VLGFGVIEDRATAQADIARLARRYSDPQKVMADIKNVEQKDRLTPRVSIERVYEGGF
jgi:hypothetical protein